MNYEIKDYRVIKHFPKHFNKNEVAETLHLIQQFDIRKEYSEFPKEAQGLLLFNKWYKIDLQFSKEFNVKTLA